MAGPVCVFTEPNLIGTIPVPSSRWLHLNPPQNGPGPPSEERKACWGHEVSIQENCGPDFLLLLFPCGPNPRSLYMHPLLHPLSPRPLLRSNFISPCILKQNFQASMVYLQLEDIPCHSQLVVIQRVAQGEQVSYGAPNS